MSEAILQIKNLKKYFPVRGKKGLMVHAVDDVSSKFRVGRHSVSSARAVAGKAAAREPSFGSTIRTRDRFCWTAWTSPG